LNKTQVSRCIYHTFKHLTSETQQTKINTKSTNYRERWYGNCDGNTFERM